MNTFTPLLTILLISLLACSNPSPENNAKTTSTKAEKPTVRLKKLWSSADGFVTPEAIIYDEARNVFYVANINKNPWGVDKNGFISKMNYQGQIIDLKWVTSDLSAPKGMAIEDGKLLVADINQLVIIDIETGSINGRMAVAGDTNLNDITSGPKGVNYVTASKGQALYQKVGNDFKPILSDLNFSPNGVLYHNGSIHVLGFDTGKMYTVNATENSLTEFASNLGSADGLEADGKGGFISSSWDGAIFHINAKGESTKLLDTSAEKKGAADIEYIAKTQTLYVPTFFDNHVDAYQVIFE